MDQIIINAELTLDDWHAYQRAAQARLNRQSGSSKALTFCIYVLLGAVTPAILNWLDIEIALPSFVAGLLLILTIGFLIRRRMLKQYAPRPNGIFLGACTYIFDSNGFSTQRDTMGSRFGWPDVTEITADADHLYFWVDSNAAITLPTRALPAELALTALQQQIDQWRPNNVTQSPADASSVSPALATQPSWPRTLLNLWLLRRVEPAAVPLQAIPIAIIVVATLGLLLGFDRYNAGTHPDFYTNNIPVIGLYALIAIAVAWILSRDGYPHVRFGQALFVVTAGIPLLIVFSHATALWVTPYWTLAWYAIVGAYLLFYLAKALRSLTYTWQYRGVAAVAAITVLFAAISAENFWTTRLWYPPQADSAADENDRTWNDSESLLFEQQQRLDDALDHVASTTPDKPTVYFVGFAGVAEQKVFAGEIELAARIVSTHFHTDQHNLRLVNDRRDLTSLPLATVTNLHYALQGMARKMNIDQDVLFLALSSHGDDEPSLQVSNGYLALQQVTGDNLAAALRDSGIKWRIIVISACHAGSFIEALKDPHTIIITAAAADKTSFGCSDDRALTYFGEAFYRDALPNSTSLEDAFAHTRAAIIAREKSEDIKASDPQAYFGAELSKKLQQLN